MEQRIEIIGNLEKMCLCLPTSAMGRTWNMASKNNKYLFTQRVGVRFMLMHKTSRTYRIEVACEQRLI